MRARRPGDTFLASLVVLSMCGGGGFRRGLGDDGVVDGAGEGVCVVFVGKSTAVAGLLSLSKGGVAESLIEHYST
jgi:hypothetical protein